MATYNEADASQRWTLAVDPSDTVLDLKFLLQPLVKADADYQRLYVWRKGERGRSECRDQHTLTQAGRPSQQQPAHHVRVPVASGLATAAFTAARRTCCAMPTRPSPPSAISSAPQSPSSAAAACSVRASTGRTAAEARTCGRATQTSAAACPPSAAGLLQLGVRPGDCIGIISVNRSEWLLTDLSCAVQGFVSVPLYDTLGPDAVKFIINHSQAKVVVCSRPQLSQLVSVQPHCPTLQLLILMDDETVDKRVHRIGRQRASLTPCPAWRSSERSTRRPTTCRSLRTCTRSATHPARSALHSLHSCCVSASRSRLLSSASAACCAAPSDRQPQGRDPSKHVNVVSAAWPASTA